MGIGSPILQAFDVTALAATGNITINFGKGVSKFQVRCKSSATNGVTTILRGVVTATDGTNVYRVAAPWNSATAAGQNFDEIYDVVLDIWATSITIAYTLGGATTVTTINTEIYGNP